MEELRRDPTDPRFVPQGQGMNADQAKAFAALAGITSVAKATDPRLEMAKVMAAQTGKTVEEVLAFMGVPASTSQPAPTVQLPAMPVPVTPPPPTDASTFLPPDADELLTSDKEEFKPIVEEPKVKAKAKVAKALAKKEPAKEEPVVDSDGFIVTEVIDPDQATDAEIQEAIPEENEEVADWSGKIREGNIVRIIWQAPGSKIKWEGKKGKVVRIVGNERAKVYDVEFAAGKVLKTRLNKKSGKLERGYVMKKFQSTFSEDQIELCY